MLKFNEYKEIKEIKEKKNIDDIEKFINDIFNNIKNSIIEVKKKEIEK